MIAWTSIRQNFNTQGMELTNGFTQDYTSANWRVGLVYNVTDYITPYISWTTGKDPPGTNNIFLVNAPEGTFALSSSHQIEAGVKSRTPNGMADMTLAVYDIKKSNLLVQTSKEAQATASQTSKGVELSTNFKLTSNWTVSANAAYTDSVYTAFTDPSSGSELYRRSARQHSPLDRQSVDQPPSYRKPASGDRRRRALHRQSAGQYRQHVDLGQIRAIQRLCILRGQAGHPGHGPGQQFVQ